MEFIKPRHTDIGRCTLKQHIRHLQLSIALIFFLPATFMPNRDVGRVTLFCFASMVSKELVAIACEFLAIFSAIGLGDR